jgi:hypothetical protein
MNPPSTSNYRAMVYWLGKSRRETLLCVARTRRGVALLTGKRIPAPARLHEVDFIAIERFSEVRCEWRLVGSIAEPADSTAIDWLDGKAPRARRRRPTPAVPALRMAA